jgi:uncharacterized protein YdeI (YjbR/CyaY-like superfamily)
MGARRMVGCPMDSEQGLPIAGFAACGDWEEWLEANHATSAGLWLKLAKKGAGIDSVSYPQALEVALCFGWIDGQKRSFDEQFWLQRFTPRSPRSRWSRINRDKAQALVEQGRMRPAGAEQIDRAKEDGRWAQAYEGQRLATVPEDLQCALDMSPAAKTFFETLDRANRYAVVYRVQDAKRPETRARRIAKFIAMLESHEKIHP